MQAASVLVTGATGFIGQSLVRQLLKLEARVTCLVREDSPDVLNDAVSTIRIKKFDTESVTSALQEVSFEYVFHLASYGVNPENSDVMEMLRANVDGTVALLVAAQKWPLKRFIFTGSCAEYGTVPYSSFVDEKYPLNPLTLYSASKVAAGTYAKTYAEQFKLPFVWLRLFGVYGPGEASYRLMPYLINLLSKKESVDLSPGEQMRDFLYISDVVSALIAAATSPTLQQAIYNICSSDPIAVCEVARAIAKNMNCDMSLLGFGKRNYRAGEVMWLVGDNAAFKRDTDWQPKVNMSQGICEMIQQLSRVI